MVNSCCAYGCKNRYKKQSQCVTEEYVQFHRFPFKKPELLAEWTVACRRQNWKPSTYSVICSTHFKKDDYQIRPGASIQYLKEEAVPSIFTFPSHLQAKERKVRRVLQRNIEIPGTSASSSENSGGCGLVTKIEVLEPFAETTEFAVKLEPFVELTEQREAEETFVQPIEHHELGTQFYEPEHVSKKMKSEVDRSEDVDTVLNEAVKALKQVTDSCRVRNQFSSFGNSLANQLAGIPLDEAIRLQSDFQRMITSARLRASCNRPRAVPTGQPSGTYRIVSSASAAHAMAVPIVGSQNAPDVQTFVPVRLLFAQQDKPDT